MCQFLDKYIADKTAIPWSYFDKRVSEYELSGNLLSEVVSVKERYKFKTPIGLIYEFDIALLGRTVNKEPLILGVIEFEKENRFGVLKCLICKSLAFPLFSIPLLGVSVSEIDDDWCFQALIETKRISDDGFRRNYIYIHNLLYPAYMNIPKNIRNAEKHQFLIFAKDQQLKQVLEWLRQYRTLLGYKDERVITIQPNHLKNNEQIPMFENEGSIAGYNWKEFNTSKYIRVTLPVPTQKQGNIYLYRLIMARLLNQGLDTLVGYKYIPGLSNKHTQNPIWEYCTDSQHLRIIPKSLSEQIKPILDYLSENGLYKRV